MKKSNTKQFNETIYENLPPILKKLTDEFDGRERDIVLLSSLGVISACIPNVYGIYDRNKIYPQIFVIIIAPPASGKGVASVALSYIEKINRELYKESDHLQKSWIESNKKKKGFKKENAPKKIKKIITPDVSTSILYEYLKKVPHGILIFDNESESLTKMFANSWSDYMNIINKLFHHELLSVDRLNYEITINEPKGAIVLTGTPSQLHELVKAQKNGLFTRFANYRFNELGEIKDVFSESFADLSEIKKEISEEMFTIYKSLEKRENPIQFYLTDSQKKQFLEKLDLYYNQVKYTKFSEFGQSIKRTALICFRISMILTVIRNKDKTMGDKLICGDKDFRIMLKLMPSFLEHGLANFQDIKGNNSLPKIDEKILLKLKETFTTNDILNVGKELKIPERTIYSKLKSWTKRNLIQRLKKGYYKKLL